jgi:hypothetical protein
MKNMPFHKTYSPYMLKIWSRKLAIVPFLLLLLYLAGCATISPSAVQLSSEVGSRITEMEELHQLALQRYFEVEKRRVEDFLKNEWEPLFLKNFLGTSGILKDLQKTREIDENMRLVMLETASEYLSDPDEAENLVNELRSGLNNARKGEPDLIRSLLKRYIEDDLIDAAATHFTSILGTDDRRRLMNKCNSREKRCSIPLSKPKSKQLQN